MFNIYKAEKILEEEQRASAERDKEARKAIVQKSNEWLSNPYLERRDAMIAGYKKRIANFMVDVRKITDNYGVYLDDRETHCA